MPHITLTCRDHIFTGTGADMRYNKPKHEYPLHNHEFHEIVYIVNGNANHYINGRVFPMSTGCLYLIRNTDIHTYSDFIGDKFEYYTLLFEKDLAEQMLTFFGSGENINELFTSPLPPEIRLEGTQAEKMSARFAKVFILMHSDTQSFRTASRLLITELVMKHFTEKTTVQQNIPLWLEYAYGKMQTPENFISGTERFFEICGRRREHCTRMLKKYYCISPADYVTGLRMNYAAGLLSSGDLSVSEVSFECGYNSVPHFYNTFRKKFGISPGKFREQSGKSK